MKKPVTTGFFSCQPNSTFHHLGPERRKLEDVRKATAGKREK